MVVAIEVEGCCSEGRVLDVNLISIIFISMSTLKHKTLI